MVRRITKRRKMILDIILEDRCSSCKEIYARVVKLDQSIGMATVCHTQYDKALSVLMVDFSCALKLAADFCPFCMFWTEWNYRKGWEVRRLW